MNRFALIPLAAAAALLGGCATDGYGYNGSGDDGWGYYDRGYSGRYGNYDWNRPDPRYGGYYADRYYRQDHRYRERRLADNDRVYRGRDGRYYCRRSDGTTGLIVGGVAGGVLGSIGGTALSRRMAAAKGQLSTVFAGLVVVVAVYMIWQGLARLGI